MKPEYIQSHAALVQIAAVVGDEATCSIVAAFGGRHIFPSYERLEPVIGRDAAKVLVRELRGNEIYIPSCRREHYRERNEELVAKFDRMTANGISARQAVRELASQYRLVERRIWMILKSYVAAPVKRGAE